jgi:hypothetical protein
MLDAGYWMLAKEYPMDISSSIQKPVSASLCIGFITLRFDIFLPKLCLGA